MTERNRRVLEKICSEIDMGLELMGDTTYDEFIVNEALKRAICMTLINIGELVKGVDEETRVKYPRVLWKQIAGMRDVAAHKYATIDMNDVYDTVKNNFPELKTQLEEILSE